MRKLNELEELKTLVEAAFKAGSSLKIMEKMLTILNKRVGKVFTLSSLPWTYKNGDGQFAGFYAFDKNLSSALRINFLLGKSDKIVSVDFFDTVSDTPTYTVDLNGLNIVQTIDTVVDVISGDYFRAPSVEESTEFKERRTTADQLSEWLKTDDSLVSRFENGRENWKDLYMDFSRFVEERREKVPSIVTFKWHVKNLAQEANIRLDIIEPNVRAGATEVGIVVDTDSQAALQATVIENEHLKKFDMMENYIRMIGEHSKYLNSLLIYGQAGIGKTTMVKNVFKDMGLSMGSDYIVKSGSIAGKTGLRQLLWDYKDDQIIILDDNDGILRNVDAVNMLKAALQDSDRIISYTAARREDNENSEPLKETVDLTDMDSDDGVSGGAIPEDFEFKSKIIFISNLMEFPPAIKSRCISIKIDMNVDQTMDMIKNSLGKVLGEFPEITIEMKEEVFLFIKNNIESLNSIDFRQFQFALVPYLAIVSAGGNPKSDKSWQDWALIQLRS